MDPGCEAWLQTAETEFGVSVQEAATWGVFQKIASLGHHAMAIELSRDFITAMFNGSDLQWHIVEITIKQISTTRSSYSTTT